MVNRRSTLKALRKEVEEIEDLLRWSRQNKDVLELEKQEMIRAQILLDSTMIEEAINILIMSIILKDSEQFKNIEFFGRIKRFVVFYDDILGRIFGQQKLDIVNRFRRIPREIEKTTRSIFNLRNLFAHVFTVSDYTKAKRLNYKGQSILEIETFKQYHKDAQRAKDYFIKRAGILS